MSGLTRFPPCRACGFAQREGTSSRPAPFRVSPKLHNFRGVTARSAPESSADVATDAGSSAPFSEPLEELVPPGITEETQKFVARYSGRKSAKRPIIEEEGRRPLSQYMALPVSQYSVLDAARIERLGDNTFKCFIGSFKMFGMKVEPILTVNVIANEKGCSIKLLDCELDGSNAVKAVNGIFATRMSNIVSWEQLEGKKMMTSSCYIEVAAGLTPRYMRFVPIGAIERVGNAVMQQILNISVPRFLKQLEADYQNWARGDDTRGAVGTGQWGELSLEDGKAKDAKEKSEVKSEE